MVDQIRLPSGSGGLVNYFEDFKTKIEMSPNFVIGAVIAVIALEYILHNLL